MTSSGIASTNVPTPHQHTVLRYQERTHITATADIVVAVAARAAARHFSLVCRCVHIYLLLAKFKLVVIHFKVNKY